MGTTDRTTATSLDTQQEMVPTPTSAPRDQTSATLVSPTSHQEDSDTEDVEVLTTSSQETAPLSPTASRSDQTQPTSENPFSTPPSTASSGSTTEKFENLMISSSSGSKT